MEMLSVVYHRDHQMLWHAFESNHPEICTTNQKSLIEAQEAMYYIICNEFWYRYRSLSSWAISSETIHYLPITPNGGAS